MIRRLTSLRLYRRIVRTIPALRPQSKKILWTGVATTLAITGGVTLLSAPKSNPSSSQNDAPIGQPASHPLLGIDEQSDHTEKSRLNHSRRTHATAASEDAKNGDESKNSPPTMTSVTINGESIEVPSEGSSRQTIINADGSLTEVNVQSEQTSSGGHPTSNLIINSHLQSNSSSSASINSRITISH